jgi:hypothetical protein
MLVSRRLSASIADHVSRDNMSSFKRNATACHLDVRVVQDFRVPLRSCGISVFQSRRPETISHVSKEETRLWRLSRRYVSRRILPDLSLQNVMTVCRSRLPTKSRLEGAKYLRSPHTISSYRQRSWPAGWGRKSSSRQQTYKANLG